MPALPRAQKALRAPSKASTLDRRRASHRDASCAASRRKVLQRTVVLAASTLGLRREPALADREGEAASGSLQDWSQLDNRCGTAAQRSADASLVEGRLLSRRRFTFRMHLRAPCVHVGVLRRVDRIAGAAVHVGEDPQRMSL